MKLKEALSRIRPDELICIGITSGFFFFGSSTELSRIEEISQQYQQRAIDYAKNCPKRLKDMAIKRMHEFTPLLDREVVAHYRQSTSDYAYVLVIEGYEAGMYWFKHEYDEAVADDTIAS